ncbi:MAG: hypothetical protein NUW09_02695 [Deltaproteobacteria bacterium]|nr:hypothetical protein [Deltaproteobacteria bacterium]
MNPNNNRKRGKRNEHALAKRLNGKRVGILGKEDISCGPFSLEVKSFARFAGVKIMEQAERNAPEGKTPLAIVHIRGQRRDADIVMLRLKEWEDWNGRTKVTGGLRPK